MLTKESIVNFVNRISHACDAARIEAAASEIYVRQRYPTSARWIYERTSRNVPPPTFPDLSETNVKMFDKKSTL